MGKAIEASDANFSDAIKTDELVMVDFWAEWCGPCKMLSPILEDIANEYSGKVSVVKVDVDSNPVTSMEYGIRAMPTVIFLKNGEIVERHLGYAPKAVFDQKIAAHI
jgi:thioredoxin 1